MRFDDILEITEDSLVHEINRICGTDNNNYPIKAKAARVNASLDRYFSLAFEADGRWNFDDINETSPPIDTQNIVSGTNRYKFSDFTEKVLSLIKLEILDADANGHLLIPEIMEDISNFQQLYVDAGSGTPTHYTKYGDFIYLRPKPNYNESDALLVYFNRPAIKFAFTRFTVTIASPGVVTATAHGMAIGDIVIFQTSGALPTGLSVDILYYLVATVATNTFSLALTLGGTAINTSGSQSGVHSFLQTNIEPGIPVIHHPYLARYASLPFLIEKNLPQASAIAQQIQIDELAIGEYFAQRDKDVPRRMIPAREDNR